MSVVMKNIAMVVETTCKPFRGLSLTNFYISTSVRTKANAPHLDFVMAYDFTCEANSLLFFGTRLRSVPDLYLVTSGPRRRMWYKGAVLE